ncbi:iron chelate uptake ABC transporter family permease subunit, partial [Desulfobulbus sp. US2]|nr:iron chelate uptake ABC transporter family permease subunit [Desulfobulbus sp. US2]
MAIAVRSGVSYITGGGLFLLLLLGVVVSATMGFMQIPATTVLQLIGHALSLSGKDAGFDPVVTAVVMDVRLPRILAAVLVGGMLALCGTVFQAILLNPLADPYTLGISSGAAFGASLVIVLQVVGLALPSALSVPIFAFAGSI